MVPNAVMMIPITASDHMIDAHPCAILVSYIRSSPRYKKRSLHGEGSGYKELGLLQDFLRLEQFGQHGLLSVKFGLLSRAE